MNKPTLKEQAHGEIEKIFRILLPQNGLSVREEQITLCHAMLDTLLKNNIALCDAGVGIGKTYSKVKWRTHLELYRYSLYPYKRTIHRR